MRNRDTIVDRYQNDPEFHMLVKTVEQFIYQHKFTPSEIRDACFLAQYLYEQDNPDIQNKMKIMFEAIRGQGTLGPKIPTPEDN